MAEGVHQTHQTHPDFVTVEEAGPQGMITLRGNLANEALRAALREVVGQEVPAPRRINLVEGRGAAWMSPDELLLMLPHAQAPAAVERLRAALEDEFALAVDVSDARAVFHLHGARLRDVLAKLCPVDFATMEADEIRRTRAAQAAVGLWFSGTEEVTLICFRSVAGYMFDLLSMAARPGGEVGFYPPTSTGQFGAGGG